MRTAIRFLRYRVGGWQPLAAALGVKADSLGKVLRGARDVTARLAYSVARLTDVSIERSRLRLPFLKQFEESTLLSQVS